MHNEIYEDYIRYILGYPNYGSNYRENEYQEIATNYRNNEQNAEIESCYPEIYKIVYPMVAKVCNNNTRPVTSSLIDELTNEIYLSIESNNEINVTINLNNEVGGKSENRANATKNSTNNTNNEKTKETRGEDRQFRNRGLQDLIRILLIRELIRKTWEPSAKATNETTFSRISRRRTAKEVQDHQ